MEHSFLIHAQSDDVAVAVRDVAAGTDVVAVYMNGGEPVRLISNEDVPLGHKIALKELDEGAEVHKYGIPIGRTTRRVNAGDYVHTHNLRSARW
jgi:(2R)-sulfolactate sulfo-lyase subunit alpha